VFDNFIGKSVGSLQWYCLLSCKGQATNSKRLAQYRVITQFRVRSLRLNLTISTFSKHPIDWVRTTPIWTFAPNRSKFSQDSDNEINRSPLRDERRHHFDWFGGDSAERRSQCRQVCATPDGL
jgi:hypothetical protein